MAYLDHAATTPMLPEAIAAMTTQLAVTGNASSLHAAGRRARRTVEESRETLADALGARPSEVVLTSGGTEADNLAVKGLYWARRDADPRRTRVLASPVEHHAVLDAVDWLAEHEGATVEYLPVDAYGRVHPDALREALARDPDDVALVTVMWANNEIGTIMPIRELAQVAREFDVPMHADAVQAFGQLEVDFARSGLAAMTVSAHKIGGPFGIGALLLGREYTPVPVLHGGGQERHVRSGTLDVPAVAAFAVAGRHAADGREGFMRQDRRAPGRAGRRRPEGRPRRPPRRRPRARRAASGQRPLHLPRLRGRLPAAAARRPGHRMLHRVRVHRRDRAAQSCAAGHGNRPRPRARHAALLARPHLDRAGRRGARAGDRPCCRAGPDGGAQLAREPPVDAARTSFM